MTLWLRSLLCLVLLCLAPSLALAAAGAEPARVLDLRFGVEGPRSRVVVDLSGPVEYRVRAAAEPFAVILDLPPLAWAKPAETGTGSGLFGTWRYGRFDDQTGRLILETDGAVVVKRAFLLAPRAPGDPTRLAIDIVRASPEEAAALTAAHAAAAEREDATATRATPDAAALAQAGPEDLPVVVIDPGHGGVDPGAISANDTYEKTIVLAISLRLKQVLEATGRYRVILTRDKDVFLKLAERVAIARAARADLLLSIHADSIRGEGVRGASLYILSEKASDAEAELLASRENRVDVLAGLALGPDVTDPVATDIILDLVRRETMARSRRAQEALIRSMQESKLPLLRTPKRSAGFAVLKAPDVPSVLMELGYLSNPEEAAALADPKHQDRLVTAIAAAIEGFFAAPQVAAGKAE